MGAENEDPKGQGDPGEKKDPEDQLGDPGKKALEQERKARRDAESRLAALEKQLKEIADKDKSESEKTAERLAAAERERDEARLRVMRLEVGGAKGLTPKQAARLVGSTVEELEADAAELLASFAPQGGEGAKPPPSRKPAENLTPGGADREDPEPDIDKVLEKIPRL
jgi:hypothetical protein